MILSISGWKGLRVVKDKAVKQRFLFGVAEASRIAFIKGILSKKHGRIYKRRGGDHRASAPNEYPARDTGALLASIDTDVTAEHATIGTNMHYSIYLRMSTMKMERRKMSDDALKEGMRIAPRIGHFVKWRN